MSNLSSTISTYEFNPAQQNAISAPIGGQYFAEQDVLYTQNNSSIKAPFGTSNADQISFDAANRQMFNDYAELGVDCGRVNSAAARPDMGIAGVGVGAACPGPSPSFHRAMMQMDSGFNAYGPSAEQLVLAQGDVLYAPARFADQNSYAGPSMSDFTFQSRLMGTRDTMSSGCETDVESGITMCALRDDPLPYPTSEDPRTMYGVNEPYSQYWAGEPDAGYVPKMCNNINNASAPNSVTSMCNLKNVEPGRQLPRLPVYNGSRMCRAPTK